MSANTNVDSNPKIISQRTIAIAVLIGVNALWGLSFPIMKSLNQQMEHSLAIESEQVGNTLRLAFSSGMIGIRFLVSFFLLCIFCPRLVRDATLSEWTAGAAVGLLFYFGLVLQVMGLATIPASRSGFLTSLTAVFTPIFTSVLFRRIPTWNVVAGGALALLGVSVLTGVFVFEGRWIAISEDAMSRWTIGDSLTALGAVLFTGQLMLVDYYGRKINTAALTPSMFVIVTFAACVTFAFLFKDALPAEYQTIPLASRFWLELFFTPSFFGIVAFLAIFCSVFAFLGMNKYQPHITAVQASVVYSTEPVFASSWALFLPSVLGVIALRYGYSNEKFSLPLFLGGTLILLANIVALWPRAKPKSQSTEANGLVTRI